MSSETIPSRGVAKRAFAGEINDGTHVFQEDEDDDQSPKFQLLPTGERANRLLFVGTLTATEDVGDDGEYYRARVVGPTGTVFAYAGQYRPGARTTMKELEPPAYVALVAKPQTYETDEGETNVSLDTESLTEVSQETRDQWVAETARQTIDRVKAFNPENDDDDNRANVMYNEDPATYTAAVVNAIEDELGIDEGDDEE